MKRQRMLRINFCVILSFLHSVKMIDSVDLFKLAKSVGNHVQTGESVRILHK